MAEPSGVHHIALMTNDMKGQIEFFSDVLGMPLVGLFDMHGVPGAWHGFLKLSDTCYLALCMVPGVESVPSTVGLTHAGNGAGVSAPGTLQHLAFKVNSQDELLALRDRIRSRGINVFGPIDHGMCQSIYFGGPEGLALEAAWSAEAVDGASWVDPSVCTAAGISAEDMQRFMHPAAFTSTDQPVPQPAIDPAKPHLVYPADEYARMVATPDNIITKYASYPDPPVKADQLPD